MIPMTKIIIIIDYKIFHMRTLGLSIQKNGPATVKLTIFHNHGIPMEITQFYSFRSFILY